MIKPNNLVSVAAALGLVTALAGNVEAQQRYKHATGPSGGYWFIAMGGAVNVLNQSSLGVRFDAIGTRGSGENTRAIGGSKSMHFGLANIPTLYNAKNGLGDAFKGRPAKSMLILGKYLQQRQVFYARQETGIQTVIDLVGKKFSLGPRGSGAELANRNILTALGIFDSVDRKYLGFGASGRAVANRQIDAFASGNSPCTNPTLIQASQSRPVRLLNLTQADYSKIAAKYPYFSFATCDLSVDSKLREVKGFAGSVNVVSFGTYYISNDQVPAQVAYDVLKSLLTPKNQQNLIKVHKSWRFFSGEFEEIAKLGMKIHPGAVRYWREKGVNIPSSVIP